MPLCLSSWTSTPPEDVINAARANGGGQAFAMQVTIFRDRSISVDIIKRAEGMSYALRAGVF
jgi:hypothetical protein